PSLSLSPIISLFAYSFSALSLQNGSRLGPYEVVSPLGVGGMGEVYRARDTRLERDVAIKVLPQKLASDPEALERFEREAKAVAALSHPNILGIYDLGSDSGVTYAAMELLTGETLRQRLAEGPIPQRRALDYGLQLAYGLAAAHEKGIVHRDLKPENIFLTSAGRVKILDFGLAKVVARNPHNPHSPPNPARPVGRRLDAPRQGDGDRRLHVTRRGPGQPRRRALGHLLARMRALRDALGRARVPRRVGGRDDGGDRSERSARALSAVGP